MARIKKDILDKPLEKKDTVENIKQKRGRKPKKLLQTQDETANCETANDETANDETVNCETVNLETVENIVVSFEESIKNEYIKNEDTDIILDVENAENSENESIICEQKPVLKKRGRKPKGGKIIQQIVNYNNDKENKPNVILHLKCSLKDLQFNSFMNSKIENYDLFSSNNVFHYENITENDSKQNLTYENKVQNMYFNEEDDTCACEETNFKIKENDNKEIWKKLKAQEHNLHINNISDKKSACFWCTYEFDNPPIYIPKHFIKDTYHVYGCFCSPECSTAYLMEENIDSSTKFERYHLLNHIYSKIYNYTKNIKPAPNPYYMLEKYYGNLNIQEYRSLLKNERLFLIVDKPLTRILPELHEDNDDFIINNKIIPSNTYQVKKRLQQNKHQTKNNIVNEKFGISQ
jgi:hypothetical protein